jgi:hypothetical protein
MTHGFICYLQTLQELLLILCSLGGNNRSATAKQMDGTIPVFDLFHYEKNIPHKHLSSFVQGLLPYFHKTDDGKCDFP